MSSTPPDSTELISIAKIARPQGRHGEVIADILTDFPERFAKLKAVWSVTTNGQVKELQVERAWLHQHRVVLKFEGYDDMNQAETLRGVRLAVTNKDLVTLPADTFYDFDLKECDVVTTSGEALGIVTAVERYGAAPLLKVCGDKGEYLIPLVLSICVEIDTARKRIVVAPPEGLLEL